MKTYSAWDIYETAEGFRVYRDELHTGDGIRHMELGNVYKNLQIAKLAILALNNQEENK